MQRQKLENKIGTDNHCIMICEVFTVVRKPPRHEILVLIGTHYIYCKSLQKQLLIIAHTLSLCSEHTL